MTHRYADVNGIRLHVAEAGEGPLVVLLHGFPEIWYSWRHQLTALAAAGYRAVAPDQRGYGRSERPAAADAYTLPHLAGDVVALVHALGERRAVLVGHDWGAPVAWTTALLRPDLVRGVAALSVPLAPRAPRRPLAALREALGEGFYQIYFQQPSRADAELAADPRGTLRRVLTGGSGEAIPEGGARPWVVPPGGGLLDALPEHDALPAWLTEHDLDVYAEAFAGPDGFTGGLDWYRNIDRNWELTAFLDGAVVRPPALYVVGDRDVVTSFPGARASIDGLADRVPRLTGPVVLPGCGHWTQQERPGEVDAALLAFLDGLD